MGSSGLGITTKVVQMSPRMRASKLNGRAGGKRTAEKHGPDFVQARGEKGGRALLARYGRGYFRTISQKRKSKPMRLSASPA